jgi:hypothetical protein
MMEDAATLTRRLLELAIQAEYIGHPDAAPERERRAGRYLAFAWRQIPRRVKLLFPSAPRARWSGLARTYGRLIRSGAKRWGPTLRDMFASIGHTDLYNGDYALLSGIAHGGGHDLPRMYSATAPPMYSHEFASILLVFSSRYALAVAGQWATYFPFSPPDRFDALALRVTRWRPQ